MTKGKKSNESRKINILPWKITQLESGSDDHKGCEIYDEIN